MTYREEQRISEIERRLDRLEGGRHGKTVRGWSAAARVLGVADSTVHRWFKTDPRFPSPVRVRTTKCGVKPEWNLAQLTDYR